MAGQIIWATWAYIDGTFQKDSGVYVENTTIVETGTRTGLTRKYLDATLSGGEGCLMLPGLINSHDHGRALGTASLGAPDSFLEVWLTYLRLIPRLPPRLAATYEGLQLIHSGVTATAHSHNPASFEMMFAEVPETLQGYRDAGVRVAMHPPFMDQNRLVYNDHEGFLASLPLELHDIGLAAMQPPTFTVEDYFRELDALYEQYHDIDEDWVHIQVSPVGGQWASDDFTCRCIEWARARQTRVQMHMLETRYQRRYAFRQWNKGFIQHLDDIGALGDWLTLAHMVWIEETDADLLAERGARVAHNPSSNLRLRSGVAPIPALHQAGVIVGIGLDGHGLDDDQDFLREMRLAFTLANRPDALEVSPLAVLEMGTRNGALITFGERSPLGMLAAGRLADIVLVDWSGVKGAWCPPHLPAEWHVPEFFLRRATRNHVRHVMVHGDWVLRDGQHTGLDESEVTRAVQDALANQSPPDPSPLSPHIRRFYTTWETT